MALEPCNVCGTLNSSNADICLSCGYPTKGQKRSSVYQWVAIALLIAMVSMIISGIIDAVNGPSNRPPRPLETTPTLDV